MCGAAAAVTGASAGLQIAGSAAGYMAEREAFKDRKEYLKNVHSYQSRQLANQVQYRDDLANYQNERYVANAAAVNKDVSGQYGAINERLRQEDEAAKLEVQALSRQSREASSLAAASAAERGIEGASLDALMGDLERAETEATFVVSRQLEFNRSQARRVLGSIEAQGQSRINQYLPQPLAPINMPAPLQGINGPNGFASLMGLAGGLAGTAGQYFTMSSQLKASQDPGGTG